MTSRTPATDAAFTDPSVTEGQQRGLCAEFEHACGYLKAYVIALEEVCDADQLRRAQKACDSAFANKPT